MNIKSSRTGTLLACAAALSMVASPAFARGGGWGGGWGRGHDDIDAGDVITGILIIGGIAAIASAASSGKKQREQQERDRDYREPSRSSDRTDSRGYAGDDRPVYQEGRGIDGAVNRCVSEVERGSRKVDGVDGVSRDGTGWRVTGRVTGGQDFACTVDGEGRIRNSTVGGQAAWNDEEDARPAA